MKTFDSASPFREIYSPPGVEVIETWVEGGFAATAPADFSFDTI